MYPRDRNRRLLLSFFSLEKPPTPEKEEMPDVSRQSVIGTRVTVSLGSTSKENRARVTRLCFGDARFLEKTDRTRGSDRYRTAIAVTTLLHARDDVTRGKLASIAERG